MIPMNRPVNSVNPLNSVLTAPQSRSFGLSTITLSMGRAVGRVNEVVCALFRTIDMSIRYAVGWGSISLRRWCRFPSPIQAKHIKVPARNIAHPRALLSCLQTAWRPLSKEQYSTTGHRQGLRVTHDITYQPANGICLGISLSILAYYCTSPKGKGAERLLHAANTLQYGAPEGCERIQALQDALLGVKGRVKNADVQSYFAFVQSKNSKDIAPSPFLNSLQAFKLSQVSQENIDNRNQILRKFMLDDLERKGVILTPDLYALVLELDAVWEGKGIKQYRHIHYAIIETLASFQSLEVKKNQELEGEIPEVRKKLIGLESGAYLIQFFNHSIALIKMDDGMALLDPNAGLALLQTDQQTEALTHLLKYYGKGDKVGLRSIRLQSYE
jgi:hypothetical protein